MADSLATMSSTALSRSLSQPMAASRRRSYSSYLRWSKNMRMSPQSTDTLLTIALGLGLRYIVDTVSGHSVKVTGSIVGLWEGIVLLHFTKKTPKSSDPFIAFGARMFVDFVCTESFARLILVLLWMWLGVVLADVTPAIWSDRRVKRIRRHLRRKVRRLTETVPTIVFSPPIQRTIRFVPSQDMHTILEESTQASGSVAARSDGPEVIAPVFIQRETPIHAPLIAIIPALQSALAGISASQGTPVIQISDFLPPVSTPLEEPHVALPLSITTPDTPILSHVTPPVDNIPYVEESYHETLEATEPVVMNPSSVSIVEVPNIEDMDEIADDEAEVNNTLPSVIRQSGASTPNYASDRHSHIFASPPPDYDAEPLRITHSPEPEFGDDDDDNYNDEGAYHALSIPIYDINDLAEIQNESQEVFMPTFDKSRSATPTPRFDSSGAHPYAHPQHDYVPPTPPESTTNKRRKVSHHEQLPEGYFPPPRPVPRRQPSKALPPRPTDDPEDDDDGSDIYVRDDVEPAAARMSVASAAEGWEKVDMADYAFALPQPSPALEPPTPPEKDDSGGSPYGATDRPKSAFLQAPSPHYSEGSSNLRYSTPKLASSSSQESDQELKALVHDLGSLIQ